MPARPLTDESSDEETFSVVFSGWGTRYTCRAIDKWTAWVDGMISLNCKYLNTKNAERKIQNYIYNTLKAQSAQGVWTSAKTGKRRARAKLGIETNQST